MEVVLTKLQNILRPILIPLAYFISNKLLPPFPCLFKKIQSPDQAKHGAGLFSRQGN